MNHHLRPDMSKEEFFAIAKREPETAGQWVYRLERYVHSEEDWPVYPKVEMWADFSGLFLSLKDAETKILELTKVDTDCYIWGYCIDQLSVGESTQINNMWLYDRAGNLLDHTNTLWYGPEEDTAFFGRPENRNRFKPGDIVEVKGFRDMHLAVIVHNPPTPQWCFDYLSHCKYDKYGYGLDASDDCCYLLAGPTEAYHEHVQPVHIMSPRFEIPDDIRREMSTWVQRAYRPIEKETQLYISTGEYFYSLWAYIQFDSVSERHYLRVVDSLGNGTCLSVYAPEYLCIEGLENALSLSDDQLKALVLWLNEKDHLRSRWWYILREWNRDSDEAAIELSLPIPDYLMLGI